jgi:hypothetical protein
MASQTEEFSNEVAQSNVASAGSTASSGRKLSHLKRLEAESIHILREAAAEFSRPVMLYSIGSRPVRAGFIHQPADFPARLREHLYLCSELHAFELAVAGRGALCGGHNQTQTFAGVADWLSSRRNDRMERGTWTRLKLWV